MSEWAAARAAYEAGDPLRAIAAAVGVSHTTIRKRAQLEEWKRAPAERAPRVESVERVETPVETPGDESAGQTGFPTDRARAAPKRAGDARDDRPPLPGEPPSSAPPVVDWPAYEARLLSLDEEGQRRIDRAFQALEEAEAGRPELRPW
jgi:hypothetical protein